VFLQRCVAELVHGRVRLGDDVFDRVADVADVRVDYLIAFWTLGGAGPDRVDERLD